MTFCEHVGWKKDIPGNILCKIYMTSHVNRTINEIRFAENEIKQFRPEGGEFKGYSTHVFATSLTDVILLP